MTATTYPARAQIPQFPVIPVLLVIAAVVAGTFAVQLMMHANQSHPDDAEWVRNCLNRNGTLQLWQITNTNKFYRVCSDGEKFGIQAVIQEGENGWREITSFIKNKMHVLEDVERYLRNSGATRIW